VLAGVSVRAGRVIRIERVVESQHPGSPITRSKACEGRRLEHVGERRLGRNPTSRLRAAAARCCVRCRGLDLVGVVMRAGSGERGEPVEFR
jgi:hypothetical protein